MNDKLREALAIVEKYGMKGDVIYKEIEALAASKQEPLEKLTRLTEEMGLYPWQESQAQAAPSQVGGREMQTPVAWVVRFNDPDPQIDIEFTQECPAGWVGRAEPLYEGPTVRNIELLHRAQRAEAQLAAILEDRRQE